MNRMYEYEDLKLMETVGKRNSFRTPEGYFDGLTASIMANIPEEHIKKPSLMVRLTRWASAAAASVILILGIQHFIIKKMLVQPIDASYEMADVIHEDDEQELLDYAMIDFNDVYYYLSEDSQQ